MYEILLFIHSWVRWIVLIALVAMAIRSWVAWLRQKPWTGNDQYFVWATAQLLTYQAIFGITLYLGLSPYVKLVLRQPELLQSQELYRFWGLRHGLSMIGVVGAFHAGKAVLRRRPLEDKHRFVALGLTGVLALLFSAIPWPGLSYGRPWFRLLGF